MTGAQRPIVVRGTGSIGQRHLRVLRGLSDGPVLACPVRGGRLAELRAQGIDAALESDLPARVRGTVVATTTARHLSDVTGFLERGDVLVEKPLAPSTEGLAKLAATAQRLNRRIFVAYCLRFRASLQAFRERLTRIGGVRSVRVVCESYLPEWRPGTDYRASYSARPDEGGVLRDLSHELDYATWLFGRPRDVSAAVAYSGELGIAADDSADLQWVGDGGCRVSVRLSYLSRTARRSMTAVGECGEISWDAVANRVTCTDLAGRADTLEMPEDSDVMYSRQAEAFLAACDGGDARMLATFDEGAFVTALADAARRSGHSGRPEPVLDWQRA